MEIYIHKDGQQYGPFSLDEINSKVRSGGFSSSDPAWIEGWSDWQTLAAIPGFITKPSPPPFKPLRAAQISEPFSDDELRGINQARKGVIWAFLAWIVFLLAFVFAGQIGAGIFRWVPACFSAVCVYRLAVALKWRVVWIYPILIFLPLVGFIVMIVITRKATKALRAGGLEVGFMGVSSATLDALGKTQDRATVLPTNPPTKGEEATDFSTKQTRPQSNAPESSPPTGNGPATGQWDSDEQEGNQENMVLGRLLQALGSIILLVVFVLVALGIMIKWA